MPKATVNGKEVEFDKGMTVLQVCERAGEEIPRFCYHERLKIAGNCRMCLVQVEGGPPKPAASCAMPAGDNMVIHTNTPMVKKAREGVMEFLLINHPLDCPICDQGGECDLQDQSMTYGRGTSRYGHEHKRAVPEKNMGPLIKTQMTRCIHCTRCVRFIEDVAGTCELGGINRGEHMEITTYLDKNITSELSGNIVDLCPVGALTSRPYAFKARPWELSKTESIDVLDAVGSNIRIDSRGMEVVRILPRLNEEVNEEWIADKTRYAYDGLKLQRLARPYVRKDGKLQPASWAEAYTEISEKLKSVKGSQVAAIAGDLADVESMFALKSLMKALGSGNIDCRQDGAKLKAGNRNSYLFNTTIAGIEKSDFCLIIGSNPRLEAPIINSRIRKAHLAGMKIARVGAKADLNYKYTDLGDNPKVLAEILSGKHDISAKISSAKNPMLIVGSEALRRADGDAILTAAYEIAEKYNMVRDDWKGFNVLHMAASRVGGLDIGFVPDSGLDTSAILKASKKGDVKVVYLLGADEVDVEQLGDAFVIYQGHHGDKGAHRADVILPGAAYTEKNGTYVNTEGRVQRAYRAVQPVGEAREDWNIIKELAYFVGHELPFEDLAQLRRKIEEAVPHLGMIDAISHTEWKKVGEKGDIKDLPFEKCVKNFYMTDPISRASRIMARCTDELLVNDKEAA